jgi:hypothetical protein
MHGAQHFTRSVTHGDVTYWLVVREGWLALGLRGELSAWQCHHSGTHSLIWVCLGESGK